MMQEAGLADFLFGQSLAEMNPFLLFLVSVSWIPNCYGIWFANLFLRALPLDRFFGVVRPWRCSMIGLNLEVFFLFWVC